MPCTDWGTRITCTLSVGAGLATYAEMTALGSDTIPSVLAGAGVTAAMIGSHVALRLFLTNRDKTEEASDV